MFKSKLLCPQCKHPILPNATRCPHCKKTIPKKHIEDYQRRENKFWIVFLASFILFLIFPILFYDYLGGQLTGIVIAAGIPISFVIALSLKNMSGQKKTIKSKHIK